MSRHLPGVCFSFSNSGRCSFGDRCRYSHDIPPGLARPQAEVAGTGSTMQAQAKKVEMSRNRPAAGVCFSFRKSGRCSYGDRCRYSHDIPTGSAKPQAEDARSRMQAEAKKVEMMEEEVLPFDHWTIQYLRMKGTGRYPQILHHVKSMETIKTGSPPRGTGLKLVGTARGIESAKQTLYKILQNRKMCSLELPPKLDDRIITKDGYSVLRKCQDDTGALVHYKKEERKLEIHADDNAKCEKAKEWIQVNIFIEAIGEKWKFFETHAGPDTEVEFERVPVEIQEQLLFPVARVHQNYFYMKLAGPEDSKAQPGRLKTSIYHKEGAGGIEEIKRRMKEVLGSFEQQQRYYKVGMEARFGRIIWGLPEDVVAHPQWRLGDFQENIRINGVALRTHFYTKITSDMEALQHAGVCSPPMPPKQVVDITLSVTQMQLGASVLVKCKMVVEETTSGDFVLLNLYHPFEKTPKIDLVCLGKSHDIRLACDCAAAMDPDSHHDLFQIAEKVVKTIQRTPDRKLQIIAKGDNYTVTFLRDKKQTQYPLEDCPNWVIVKYEVKEFRMCDGPDGQFWTVDSLDTVHFQNEKVELELWKEKFYGDRATWDTVTEEYCYNVRRTNWTTEDIVADMEDFIEAAVYIAELLT